MFGEKAKYSLTTGQKLLRNLLLTATVIAALWYIAGRPLFSAQQVVNLEEQRQLLDESTLLFRYDDDLYGYSFAAGVTDNYFHLTRVQGGPLLWKRNGGTVYSFPLTGAPPLMLLSDNYAPPDTPKAQFWFTAAAYCPGAVSGTVTLSTPAVDGITAAHLSSTLSMQKNGVFLFFLPKPEEFFAGTGEYELLSFTSHSYRGPTSVPITLTAEFYDGAGNVLAQSTKVYPASS